MSIQQNSNNRPSGSTAKACDAGIPIVGRTASTGVYEILKVNSDGSLPVAANGTNVTGVITAQAPLIGTNPTTGSIAAGTVIAYNNIGTTISTAGLYKINPFFIASASVLGAVNFTLVRNGTLDNYISTLTPFTDTYNPAISDFTTGYSFFWHNIVNQTMGGSNVVSYNVNSEKTVYLDAGTYKLLITVETAITMNAGSFYSGFYTFAQL